MTAYLIVRTQVHPSIKETLNIWYQAEQLPEADKTFNAVFVKRAWNALNFSSLPLSVIGLFFTGSVAP
ncbi:MAG TPA: hypothetical protein QF813_01815 [Alphaproteobacteria bacterium]|jgi:hypothetical protein|nr:hypothetical protein [Alphaproteobacteria bacterium]